MTPPVPPTAPTAPTSPTATAKLEEVTSAAVAETAAHVDPSRGDGPSEQRCKARRQARDRMEAFSRTMNLRCSRSAVRDGYCTVHHPDTVNQRRKKSADRWVAGMHSDWKRGGFAFIGVADEAGLQAYEAAIAKRRTALSAKREEGGSTGSAGSASAAQVNASAVDVGSAP